MAAGVVDLPDEYGEVVAELKQQVRGARFQAQRAVNTELIGLYWRIGATLLERAEQAQWGSRIVERLAADLRAEFPEIRGYSRANLYAMRQFATAWPNSDAIVQQPVGRLPWGHITVLLARLNAAELRNGAPRICGLARQGTRASTAWVDPRSCREQAARCSRVWLSTSG